jgi:carbonic anhydrase/acetyltransferase-like protein (isoleucine patch superfamily)
MSFSGFKDHGDLRSETRRIEALGLWRRLLARLRGDQTLRRLRKRGLNAKAPIRLAAGGAIDSRFAWAIEIGAHSIIASGVRIIAHDAAIKRLTGYTEVRPVVIGEHCYIGAGAIVLPGTVIGDGAIIGAGALVRGEIPAGSVAVGNPARVIGGIEELYERHMSLMEKTARFEAYPDSLSSSELAEVQGKLKRHGRVYVL